MIPMIFIQRGVFKQDKILFAGLHQVLNAFKHNLIIFCKYSGRQPKRAYLILLYTDISLQNLINTYFLSN